MKRKIRYCLLAKTIPEYSKRDDTCYTCSIGVSPELGLMRLYPIPLSGMKKWGIYELEVEKNKRDSRHESWKLSSYSRKNNWIGLSEDVKFIRNANKSLVLDFLTNYVYPSISDLNKKRRSIGLIHSPKFNAFWDVNERYYNESQTRLFEDVEMNEFDKFTKRTKQKEARIIFKDGDGKHNLQLNEWGLYEYQRKFKADNNAFRFLKPKDNSYLLVGNMHNHRNIWIGLNVFNLPVKNLKNLFHEQI